MTHVQWSLIVYIVQLLLTGLRQSCAYTDLTHVALALSLSCVRASAGVQCIPCPAQQQ